MSFLAVNTVLQFVCRKVFMTRLGAEVLGLNTTATNLLQFLNLAELGIGVAVAFSLYKPLFDRDEKRINEIVSLQGWMYRRIAWIVIGGAVLIGLFFPLIFSKMTLPLWYAYASFGVLLLSSLLSYFLNYREILLSADQKEYKILYSYRLWMLLRLVAQLFMVSYLDNPYIWWLATEAGFAVIATISLNRMVRRTYPFLRTDVSSGRHLRHKYPAIVAKIKQMFFHKISTYVIQQTSPLIIYGFATLTVVAYYGNYLMVVTGAVLVINAMFNGVNAGVGNFLAEGNDGRVIKMFGEVFTARFVVTIVLSALLMCCTTPFVVLWLGAEYVMPMSTLFWMVLVFFINCMRFVPEAFLFGKGMYQDIGAPIAEAILNLGLSVLFGYWWGLDGILAGVSLSAFVIVFMWKPWFLFHTGLGYSVTHFIRIAACHLAGTAPAALLLVMLVRWWPLDPASDYLSLLLWLVTAISSFGITLICTLYVCTPGMRPLLFRIAGLAKALLRH